ncbi:MAG: glycosyltransferase family 2 protein [Candidatus Levybacteria bacterium]|nr:glycosyltransferase family 2 protein [Candidatus Levybacteria bacterium]
MIDLSIIIVNYNTKVFLKNLLDSIEKSISKKITYEVIAVDNASTDASASAISNFQFPISNLRLIINKKNLGFAKANNQGIRASQESRYLLFLNPDTLMQENTIEEMIKFMDTHEDAGAATCKIVMPNGEIDDASHRGFPTPWNSFSYFSGFSKIFPKSKLFSGYNLGWMDFGKAHEIDACAGAFMVVRRSAGEAIGWWDEDYFFYGEDLDFCYMLKQKGWKVYYVPQVWILHYKGVAGGIKKISQNISTADLETKRRATKARFSAMKIFYKKHYEKKYPKITTWLVKLAINLKLRLAMKNA